jgi:hypothetical protein
MIIDPAAQAVRAPLSRTARPIIQNLGPGTLFMSSTSTNIASEGLKLVTNAVYELPTSLVEGLGEVWLVATGDVCDVRILNVG